MRDMIIYNTYLSDFFYEMRSLKQKNEESIEQVLTEYRQSKTLPRKKKKKVRKELLVRYSLFKSLDRLADLIGSK